jgi:hypothetical protein
MVGICLVAGLITATLPLSAFTLGWTHSIEKIRWEEDWHIDAGALVISEARIRGSGAGMEPQPDAVLKDGVWHYRPALPPQTVLRLTHSPYPGGYELCVEGRCRTLADYLPGIDNSVVIELRECQP